MKPSQIVKMVGFKSLKEASDSLGLDKSTLIKRYHSDIEFFKKSVERAYKLRNEEK